jgi:hypothetical protein
VNRLTRHVLRCPACERILWGSTAITDPEATPSSGDGTVCDGCGEILIFTDTGLRVALTADLNDDPKSAVMLLDLQRSIRARKGEDS